MLSPTPHKPSCPVYRFAEALIGIDRRGICKCGAEQANEPLLRAQVLEQARQAKERKP